MEKSHVYGGFVFVCVVPYPNPMLKWFITTHLGHIQSMLHHWIEIICPTWPSAPDIPTVTSISYNSKVGIIWGGFEYDDLGWIWVYVASGRSQDIWNSVASHIAHPYRNISSPDSDGLPCVFLNPRYPCSAWCLVACQNWIYLEWFQVGSIIAMSQAHCVGSLSYIWDKYRSMLHNQMWMDWPAWPSTSDIPFVTSVSHNVWICSI